MTLHLPTVLIVMLVASFVLSFSVLLVDWLAGEHDGMAAWGWGMFVHGMSYVAYALRFEGWTTVSIVISNLFVSSTMALHLLAISRFQQGRVAALSRWVMWGPVGLVGLTCLVFLFQHQWRVLVLAVIFGTQGTLMVWQVVAPGLAGPRERGRILLAAGSSMIVVMMAWRIVYVLFSGRWEAAVSAPDGMQSWSYMMALVSILTNTVGYVLIQKEHAVELQRHEATHDALTGVANRRALMVVLDRAVSFSTRHEAPLALLMVDIDHFKRVNDLHGHLAGDAVIREVAALISARLRLHDVVGRYGGEEFLILLPGTNTAGAVAAANGLREALDGHAVPFEGKSLSLTVSVGVHAKVPVRGEDAVESMLAACDRALYAAKQAGRNRVEVAA